MAQPPDPAKEARSTRTPHDPPRKGQGSSKEIKSRSRKGPAQRKSQIKGCAPSNTFIQISGKVSQHLIFDDNFVCGCTSVHPHITPSHKPLTIRHPADLVGPRHYHAHACVVFSFACTRQDVRRYRQSPHPTNPHVRPNALEAHTHQHPPSARRSCAMPSEQATQPAPRPTQAAHAIRHVSSLSP